jgi:hypothetical protein
MVIENVVSSSTGKFSAQKRNPNQDDEFWLLTEKMIQSEIENKKRGEARRLPPNLFRSLLQVLSGEVKTWCAVRTLLNH